MHTFFILKLLTFPVLKHFPQFNFMLIELNDYVLQLKDEFDGVCKTEIVHGFCLIKQIECFIFIYNINYLFDFKLNSLLIFVNKYTITHNLNNNIIIITIKYVLVGSFSQWTSVQWELHSVSTYRQKSFFEMYMCVSKNADAR